jgi:hypothetical protein
LARHPPTAAGRDCARRLRSLRLARLRFTIRAFVHHPPLSRKSSAYEVSQSTGGRGNGILAYVVLTLGLVGLGAALNGVGVYVGLAAFLIWMVWAAVGIIRCGLRNVLHPGGKIIPRVGVLVASIGVCVVLYLAAKDLVHLGFFR